MHLALLLIGLALGCSETPRGRSEDVGSEPALQILEAARRVLKTGPVSEGIGVYSDAQVDGPRDSFRTTILSRFDGLVRMEQTTGFVAGVDVDGPWTIDRATGGLAELAETDLAVVRGHELHMLALYPERRAIGSRYVGRTEFDGQSVHAIAHELPGGAEILAFYSTSDTVPLGFEFGGQEPKVTATLSEWSDGTGPSVFRRAEFRQAEETFTYHYLRVILGPQPDSAFRRSRSPPAR